MFPPLANGIRGLITFWSQVALGAYRVGRSSTSGLRHERCRQQTPIANETGSHLSDSESLKHGSSELRQSEQGPVGVSPLGSTISRARPRSMQQSIGAVRDQCCDRAPHIHWPPRDNSSRLPQQWAIITRADQLARRAGKISYQDPGEAVAA